MRHRAPLHDGEQAVAAQLFMPAWQVEQVGAHGRQVAPVPVRHLGKKQARVPGQWQQPSGIVFRALRQTLQRLGRQPVEAEDGRPRQEGIADLEADILGGRADQDKGSVFDIGKQRVLLVRPPVMDLVDGAPCRAEPRRRSAAASRICAAPAART